MNVFKFDINFFLHEIGIALQYVPTVLLLALVPFFIGLVFGTLIAIIRILKIRLLSQILTIFVILIRGTPIVLILMILYLFTSMGFDQLAASLGLKIRSTGISYTFVAVLGMSLSATAYLSEALRSVFESVATGQYEAARSIGLNSAQLFRRVVIPQAIPVAIPLLANNLIRLVKGSSVASLISVVEIIGGTMIEATQNYKYLEAYIASAVVYWALCMSIERLTALAELRVKKF
jgi:L-cystine transport system permease protein